MDFATIGRFLKGQIPRIAPPNRAFRAINRLMRGIPAGMEGGTGGGQNHALDAGEYFNAKLQGSAGTGTSPYSFDEVQGRDPTAGAAWGIVSGGRSGTSNAYEYNNKVHLGGKTVRMWRDGGVYRFNYVQRNGCKGTFKERVLGCGTGVGLPGANVAFTQSGTTTNVVTGSDGIAAFPVTLHASASIVTSKARYLTNTHSAIPPCFTFVDTTRLVPALGYNCCTVDSLAPTPGFPACDPIKSPLHLTDSNQTIDLVPCPQWNPFSTPPGLMTPSTTQGTSSNYWIGGYSFSAPGYTLVQTSPPGSFSLTVACQATYYPVTGAVAYVLICPGAHPCGTNTYPYRPQDGWILLQFWSVVGSDFLSGPPRPICGFSTANLITPEQAATRAATTMGGYTGDGSLAPPAVSCGGRVNYFPVMFIPTGAGSLPTTPAECYASLQMNSSPAGSTNPCYPLSLSFNASGSYFGVPTPASGPISITE